MRLLQRIVALGAIAMMFICLSVHLFVWDGRELWSYGTF